MKTHNNHISIVIPSVGRDKVLWETLEQLVPQLHGEDEVIIVDQNRPPLDIPDIFLSLKNLVFFWIHPPSLTKARNYGIEKAKNSYVMFLDDDIVPQKNLLEAAREAIRKHPDEIIAGAVDQKDSPRVEGVGFVNLETGEIKTNYSAKSDFYCPMFPGGHCLIPSPVAKKLKFFPFFKGSSQGEEVDFALRFTKQGGKIFFNSKMRIYHRKIELGGCRSPEFKKNFVFHHCFNEAVFWTRHSSLVNIKPFLIRMGHFLEYHSRRAKKRNVGTLLKGIWEIKKGLLLGILTRSA